MKGIVAGVLTCLHFFCISQSAMHVSTFLRQDLTAQSEDAQIPLTYNPILAPEAPVITTDPSSLEVCAGHQTTLTATGKDEIYWYLEPPPVGKPVGKGAVFVTPELEQGYYVYYAISHNAHSYSAFTSIDIVMVYPLPILTVASSHDILCAGETATISAKGSKNLSWQNGSANPEIVVKPLQTTEYLISGINTAGCRTELSFIQKVEECKTVFDLEVTSLEDNSNSLVDVNIYPNPNNGEFNVILHDVQLHAQIIVQNTLGEIVYEGQPNSGATMINIQSLANGIYIVKVLENNTILKQEKIIKQ